MLGSYILDSFNNDSKLTKLFSSLILLFFGGILVVYKLTIADKVAKWWDSSELNWLWSLYILKKFDNLDERQLDFLKNSSAEKSKINKILKRNSKNATK